HLHRPTTKKKHHTMKEEIAAASQWLVANTSRRGMAENVLAEFEKHLAALMEQKFQGHWHENDPSRGQGYRSLISDENMEVDDLILIAAEKSGITDVRQRIRRG